MEYINTPAGAELNAARRMREMGYHDAIACPGGPDGGIDVRSSRAFAQVKWRGAQVGRPELQRLHGARGKDVDKELWFFAASKYSAPAVQYADAVGMVLFTYDPLGRLSAVNMHAARRVRPPAATDRRPLVAEMSESLLASERSKDVELTKSLFRNVALFLFGGFLIYAGVWMVVVVSHDAAMWVFAAIIWLVAITCLIGAPAAFLEDRKRIQ